MKMILIKFEAPYHLQMAIPIWIIHRENVGLCMAYDRTYFGSTADADW